MKKPTKIFCLLMLLGMECFSQANQPGSTNFNAYVGTDWYKFVFQNQFTDTTKVSEVNEDDQNVVVEKRFNVVSKSSSGCWGVRVEHFLTKRFTIGLDFWYAHTSVVARVIKTEYSDSKYDTTFHYYSNKPTILHSTSAIISKDLSRLNSTLRFDLHLGRSPFFDPYFHLAMGAAFYKFVVTSSNTDVHEEIPFYFPLSFKFGSGAKFWLGKNTAGFVEVSIGGPLVVGGICYKLPQKIKLDLNEERSY
ncbi:MAG: hypothetical protein H7329_08475 [Opitutaceae bacterium]|nr:hypothetical protein [Cytophagales bacterium]